jgi:membrane protease YdiL (CAAX protease family)
MSSEDFPRPIYPNDEPTRHPLPPVPVVPFDEGAPPVLLLPPRPPHPNFWWACVWCVTFLIMQVAVQIAFFIVVLVVMLIINPAARDRLVEGQRQHMSSKQMERLLDMTLPQAIGSGFQELTAIVFVCGLLYFVAGRQWKRQIALAPPSLVHVVFAVLALPGTMILSGMVHTLIRKAAPSLSFDYSGMVMEIIKKFPIWFSLAAFAVGPAIGEELMCRGFLGRGLVARYGVGVGIMMTSLLFGLMHLDPPHVAATAVLGAVLHWIYLNGRSILLPMLMHFLNNAGAVLSAMEVPPFDGGDEDLQLRQWPLYLSAVALLAAVCWASYASRVRVVPGEGGWKPDFPGVELPPPTSDSRAVRMPLNWASAVAVIGTLVVFVLWSIHFSGS